MAGWKRACNGDAGLCVRQGHTAPEVAIVPVQAGIRQAVATAATLRFWLMEKDGTMRSFTRLLAVPLLAVWLGATPARAGQIVYGIDDSNHIVKVDLSSGVVGSWATGTTGGDANGLAFDDENERLLFRGDSNSGPFYQFDLSTNATTSLTSLPGSFGTVSSATFLDGSYLYVADGTRSLREITFGSTSMTSYSTALANFTASNLSFGDLAASTTNVLYGSATQSGSTVFFSLDLDTATYQAYTSTDIRRTGLLQLVMNADGTGLIGHSHNTGNWYNVSFTGQISQISGLKTMGLRDIASLATPVPEPGSIVLMGLGAASLAGYSLRRSKSKRV
jgi:hypothetical protein